MSHREEVELLLCDLPHSVLLHIFSFLKIQDIVNCVRHSCRLWHSLSYDRYLWKHLDLDHIGDTLTDMSFLSLLDSISDHVEKLDFGMAVHLTDVSFMHKNIHCPLIKSINFSLTTVNNVSIAYLVEKYPQLERIEINDCSYINIYICLVCLPLLKNLKAVSFDDFGCSAEPERLNNKLKDFFVACPQLESVVIDSEELSDGALASLFENCPNLSSLVLAHCQSISEEAFQGVKGKLTNIVNIGLAYTPVEDRVLKIIAESSPSLKELDITGCIHITDVGIGYVADNCPYLVKLIGNRLHHEGGCNITNVGLSMIASGCPDLRILDVNFCAGVTDFGIVAVAEHCPKLTEIGLSGCSSITDKAVLALANHCKWLYHVNLTECILITAKSVNMLMSKCKWLNNLSLETCHFLTKFNLDMSLGMPESGNTPHTVSEVCATARNVQHEDGEVLGGATGTATNPLSLSSNRHKPTVQTFSTIGSSLHMDITGDAGLSFPLVPYAFQANERHNREEMLPRFDIEDLPDFTHAPSINTTISEVPESESESESESSELAEIAYVNRFFPQPNHSHLTSIYLSFCSKIANDSIRQLAKHCPDLMYISLRGCFLITDKAVEMLVRSCSNLYFLDISGGSAIQSMKLTNGSLIAIANYSRSLKSLMICRNKLITLDGMQRILKDSKSLMGIWVTVGDKMKVTFSGILELVKDIDDRYVKITNTSQVEANGRQGNLCISLIPKKMSYVRRLQV